MSRREVWVGVGITAALIVACVVMEVLGSRPSTPALVAVPHCQSDPTATLAGTLTAQANGKIITYIAPHQPFQFVFRGQEGEVFAPGSTDIGAKKVESGPQITALTNTTDATFTEVDITAQDIDGATLTIPVTFPFPHPEFKQGGNTSPGPYCFTIDGICTIDQGCAAGVIGLVEDPS